MSGMTSIEKEYLDHVVSQTTKSFIELSLDYVSTDHIKGRLGRTKLDFCAISPKLASL